MKATKGMIDHASSLRRKIGAAACAGAFGLLCLPVVAWANGSGTTQVTVEADPSSMIEYEVPTKLPFYAAADGTLTGPTPSACQIVNKSVFGIHVTEVSVVSADGWNVVSSAEVGEAINSIDFQFGPKKQIDAAAALGRVDVSSDVSFNMGYEGSGKEAVDIDSGGDIARVTHDITAPVPTATISWTVAAGSASGAYNEGPGSSDDASDSASTIQDGPSIDTDSPSEGSQQTAGENRSDASSEPRIS